MKKLTSIILPFLVGFILISSCNSGPAPINYGSDGCTFCKMTIVDKQHVAQVVTEKGKNYKYDAIECMVNDLNNWDKPPVKLHLVADYKKPGELTDALTASYLISKEIPSPMGAFLSGFSSAAARDEMHNSVQGEKLNWNELKLKFKD
jgi:copper chaperone NosL